MEVELRVSASAPMTRAVLIYSPKPKSCDSKASDMFVEDFTRFMDGLSLSSSSPLIMGDFSYHVDDKDITNTSSFLRSLDELNLLQYVPKPTHEQGHILDLVLSRPLVTWVFLTFILIAQFHQTMKLYCLRFQCIVSLFHLRSHLLDVN